MAALRSLVVDALRSAARCVSDLLHSPISLHSAPHLSIESFRERSGVQAPFLIPASIKCAWAVGSHPHLQVSPHVILSRAIHHPQRTPTEQSLSMLQVSFANFP